MTYYSKLLFDVLSEAIYPILDVANAKNYTKLYHQYCHRLSYQMESRLLYVIYY